MKSRITAVDLADLWSRINGAGHPVTAIIVYAQIEPSPDFNNGYIYRWPSSVLIGKGRVPRLDSSAQSRGHPMNSVRITFRGPRADGQEADAGTSEQQAFPDTISASDWIVNNIPESDRGLVKVWLDDIPITGATLSSMLRPLMLNDEIPAPMVDAV